MQLGIFAKTFVRPNLEEIWDAIKAHGFSCVQFNFSCAGLPTLPQRIDSTITDRIRREVSARGVSVAAVSGTFNMIHPDATRRRFGLERLKTLAAACDRMGAPLITLCTGTRDPNDMWKRHPENDSEEAWKELLRSMSQAIETAERYHVNLGIEPEVGNVVDSAAKARKLLDEMKSSRLKIVMDGANLFHPGDLPRQDKILREAFDLLGPDVAIAHAKDCQKEGEAGHAAAGQGLLNYELYLKLLEDLHFNGPLILHNLLEKQVPGCVAFIKSKMPKQQRLL